MEQCRCRVSLEQMCEVIPFHDSPYNFKTHHFCFPCWRSVTTILSKDKSKSQNRSFHFLFFSVLEWNNSGNELNPCWWDVPIWNKVSVLFPALAFLHQLPLTAARCLLLFEGSCCSSRLVGSITVEQIDFQVPEQTQKRWKGHIL